MRTRQSYLLRAERSKEKFSRLRKRKEELRLASPPPDYPPLRIPGRLLKSGTFRNHITGTVAVVELREPDHGRSDQFAVTVDGRTWPKHGRPVGICEVRKAMF